ncbi:MAG: hypothetical protein HOI53_03955 [Francisellaceae bacterium]|jgi:hypothetical protein|nr:hypothetical protein [Francisellaceae bacterium]
MTGRGYGLVIEKQGLQKNYGSIRHRHTMKNCNAKTYYVSDCTFSGIATCQVCGKYWS